MKTNLLAFLILSILFAGCASSRGGVRLSYRDISPYEYGLAAAKTGIERYNVLLETHKAAITAGVNVDYTGIKTLELEIPNYAKHIPLTENNDFQGCVFTVTNNQRTVFLFASQEQAKPIQVSKKDIDSGDFRKYPMIAKGQCLLLIEDSNPWVENRKGFDYGHTRKDILFVKNGIAQNKVVMPYSNEESAPTCSYIKTSNANITVKNLTVVRTDDCTAITNVINITGKSEVHLSNITITTPVNNWRNDRAIRIENSTNVKMDSVTINRTYSQEEHSGYGINMNNIWNFYANHLTASGNWGVFGTNNVNTTFIENSAINRFDIHCYGRDVKFSHVLFSDGYNQLGSVYGDLIFNDCTFTNFIPVRNGGTYNAYVKHDVHFNNCVFNVSEGKNCLLRLGRLDNVINSRKELREKCWPNIYIKDLIVNMDSGVSDFVIVKTAITGDVSDTPIYDFSTVEIDGMRINAPRDGFRLFITPKPVKTYKKINCVFRNVTVNGDPIEKRKDVRIQSNVPLESGTIKFEKSLNNR